MFLPTDQVWRSWVAECDFSIVMEELRSSSEGIPADQEACYRSGNSCAAGQPGVVEEGAKSRRHQGNAEIESESPAAPVEARCSIGGCRYQSRTSRAEGQSGVMEEGATSQILRAGLDIEAESSDAPASLICCHDSPPNCDVCTWRCIARYSMAERQSSEVLQPEESCAPPERRTWRRRSK